MAVQLDDGREPIPGYCLVRRLGQGGFGEVWEASAPGDVPVALKFIRLGTAQAAPELRALEVVKRIRHPNLLDIQFAVQVEDRLIIAMPLCDRSLWDRFHDCQEQGLAGIPFDELSEYMRDAARAIDYLNEPSHPTADGRKVSVAHRDVKPHNIFLVGGSVRVADFGLVKVLESSVASHTGSMTPAYAAPEMLSHSVSPRSDQWSLAVTYYQLRTGRLPFEGTIHSMMLSIVQNPPNLIGLASAERSVLEKALSKQPEDRWISCREFVAAIVAAVPVDARISQSALGPTPIREPFDSSIPAPERRQLASMETNDSASRYSTDKASTPMVRPSTTPRAPKSKSDWQRDVPPDTSASSSRPILVGVLGGIILCGIIAAAVYGTVLWQSWNHESNSTDASPIAVVDESPSPPPEPKPSAIIEEKPKQVLEPATPKATTIRVRIEPGDAKIEVQGGKTNVSGQGAARTVDLLDVKNATEVSIVATCTGYAPEEYKLSVEPGSDQEITLRLQPLAAVLSIRVTPDDATLAIVEGSARIDANGPEREVRVTSPDGKQSITIAASSDGYEENRFDWVPRPGESTNKEIQLSPRPAILSLEIHPPEATITAVGQKITDDSGPTRSVQVDHPTGKESKTVVASLEGYREASAKWTPRPGQTSSERIALERIAPPIPSKEVENSIGMTLVLIPKGTFEMGSADEEEGRDDDEGPVHLVEITKPYYMAQCETTKGQFELFVQETGYKTEAESDGFGGFGWNEADATYGSRPDFSWRNAGFAQSDNHPVINVTWADAAAFCNWLSKKEGLPAAYELQQREFRDDDGVARAEEMFVPVDASDGYRLPTEAEWEYACRAGRSGRFSFGDDDEELTRHGNIADASARARLKNYADWTYLQSRDGHAFTAPVGRFQANAFGLKDMHGNVWEWCNDWYSANYYAVSPAADPISPSGQHRVLRGGGWYTAGSLTRTASRYPFPPHSREGDLGFRVVRVP